MRKKILELLKTGKELQIELNSKYSNILPKSIIDSGFEIINSDLPTKVNNLLSLLNLSEKKELFKTIKSLEEAIEILTNENIDEIINRAILNKELSGHSQLKNETLSVKDILENIEFGINSSIELLQMQIKTGEITKNNL